MRVPGWLRGQPQVVLQIGLDLPIPIPDLRVDDGGIQGTLSFNRSPFTCHVPWPAVFAVVGENGRGMVWPESMPEEIAAEVDREAGREDPAKSEPTLPSGVIDLDEARMRTPEPHAAASKRSPSGKRHRLPSYIRVIK